MSVKPTSDQASSHALDCFLQDRAGPWRPSNLETFPGLSGVHRNATISDRANSARTFLSSLDVHGTGISNNFSLPGFSVSGTTITSSSAVDSIAQQELARAPRVLDDSGGALRANVRPCGPVVLQCQFPYLGCRQEHSPDQAEDWIQHSISHFVAGDKNVDPPQSNKCCFCPFTVNKPSGRRSWQLRMEHVKIHHDAGHRMAHARMDFDFLQYLWKQKIIDRTTLRKLWGSSFGGAGFDFDDLEDSSEGEADYCVSHVNELRSRHK